MVSGPCSLTMSKMALVIVWVCSGGVLSSIGFIFGFGFVAKHLIAVRNILFFFTYKTKRRRKQTPVILPYALFVGGIYSRGKPSGLEFRRKEPRRLRLDFGNFRCRVVLEFGCFGKSVGYENPINLGKLAK